MNKKTLWITQTGILTALLIAWQAVTAALNNQIVTGSIVNMILIIAVMHAGLSSGITVAVISPVFAKLFGIGPFWPLIPFVMLGNVALVIVWHFIGAGKRGNRAANYIISIIAAAVCKFAVLYLTIVLLMVPLLHLSEPQAGSLSAMFSFPQLITALIGGVVAIAVLAVLRKTKKRM